MTLDTEQMWQMHRLLRKAEAGLLAPREERVLRDLMAEESPSSRRLPLDHLVDAGHVILGLFSLVGLMKS